MLPQQQDARFEHRPLKLKYPDLFCFVEEVKATIAYCGSGSEWYVILEKTTLTWK